MISLQKVNFAILEFKSQPIKITFQIESIPSSIFLFTNSCKNKLHLQFPCKGSLLSFYGMKYLDSIENNNNDTSSCKCNC